MKNDRSKEERLSVICNLDLNKYVGKWYEIGKLSAKEQKGFDNVSATYTLQKNGKIKVQNVGYKKGKKRGIKGIGWVRDSKCSGRLYVRFFWPFKGEYNVIKLAPDYRYAVVMGEKKNSLWILSRTPKIQNHDEKEILDYLEKQGFNVRKIVKTDQNRNV